LQIKAHEEGLMPLETPVETPLPGLAA